MNDIWFADEVLTDCSGSPRLLPPLPVRFAEMLHEPYLRTDTRIKQTGTVWPDTIYIFCWMASVGVNSDLSNVRIARGDVKARGPGNRAHVYFVRCQWWQTAEWSTVQWNEPKLTGSEILKRSFSLSRDWLFSQQHFILLLNLQLK